MCERMCGGESQVSIAEHHCCNREKKMERSEEEEFEANSRCANRITHIHKLTKHLLKIKYESNAKKSK